MENNNEKFELTKEEVIEIHNVLRIVKQSNRITLAVSEVYLRMEEFLGDGNAK